MQFLRDNPFVVCPDELSHIKKKLCRDGDEVKTKPKLGSIDYRAQHGRWVGPGKALLMGGGWG